MDKLIDSFEFDIELKLSFEKYIYILKYLNIRFVF